MAGTKGSSGGPLAGIARFLERSQTALKLRGVDRIGGDAIVVGRPHVANQGTIEIGDGFRLVSRPAISHMVVLKGGSIRIGDRVHIERGASISSLLEIRIGDDVQIGPYVVIMDSDFHVVGDRNAQPIPQPVHIGRRVVIEHRVTILRGARIGDGARVTSGSVVSGDVPEGVVVAGVPAIPLGSKGAIADGAVGVPELVKQVFGLAALPKGTDGPDTIPQWDSLGALKLLLAIERSLGATLGDREFRSARTIAELEEFVTASLSRRVQAFSG